MKRIICISLLILLAACPCFAKKNVNRVDASKQVDLSGKWNDTDARIVSESLIEQALSSGGFEAYKEELGRKPFISVGNFRNDTSEYINTAIISDGIETAIINSGKAKFIVSNKNWQEMQADMADQQAWQADMSKHKEIANRTQADLNLTGSVKSIVDTDNKTSVRTYFVYAQLENFETGEIIWRGENKEIKKVIGKK